MDNGQRTTDNGLRTTDNGQQEDNLQSKKVQYLYADITVSPYSEATCDVLTAMLG